MHKKNLSVIFSKLAEVSVLACMSGFFVFLCICACSLQVCACVRAIKKRERENSEYGPPRLSVHHARRKREKNENGSFDSHQKRFKGKKKVAKI